MFEDVALLQAFLEVIGPEHFIKWGKVVLLQLRAL